jgi:hypothetical protein
MSLLAEHEDPLRFLDGRLRTGIRVAQEPLRGACMRQDPRILAEQRLAQNRRDSS